MSVHVLSRTFESLKKNPIFVLLICYNFQVSVLKYPNYSLIFILRMLCYEIIAVSQDIQKCVL